MLTETETSFKGSDRQNMVVDLGCITMEQFL